MAEGEKLSVSEPEPTQQLNDHFFSQETAPAFNTIKSYSATSAEKERIQDYIREVFGEDGSEAVSIAQCESGINPYAYNPETIAKEKGITKYSSCGVFQINGLECGPSGSVLFDYRTNVDRAYQMYLQRGWSPWLNCKRKLGL